MRDLEEADVARAALAAIGRKLDGTPAAASTRQRKRAVLYNSLEYAVERKIMNANPLADIMTRNHR